MNNIEVIGGGAVFPGNRLCVKILVKTTGKEFYLFNLRAESFLKKWKKVMGRYDH